MNVLFVNWRDTSNPEAGGAEHFTEEIGRRLVQSGEDVTIFASSFNGSESTSSKFGMNIVRGGGRYTVYRRAREFVRRHSAEFDVIVDEINTIPFQIHKVNSEKPLVALIHQLAREVWFYETRFPLSAIGYYALERWWLRGYRDIRTVTVSASTKKDLMSLGFKDVRIVHNGINAAPLKSAAQRDGAPILIFLGRLVRCKLPDHAIKAFAHIRTSFPAAELWVLGDGYLRTKLESRRIHGVRFFGRVTEEEKFALLKRGHVLLAPSVREGWGVSVIEANAMGTPAVGYDVPGLRDSIIGGVTGFLVTPFDHIAMANKVKYLLGNPEVSQKVSRECIEWAKKFSWDEAAYAFHNVLQSTIKE